MTDTRAFDVIDDTGIPVVLPSGAEHFVLTEAERDYMVDKIERYLSDNHFTNVVDFLEVDKLVVAETLIHRWGLWLSKGQDYWGDEVAFKQVADLMNDYTTQCRQLKKQLGLDKVTRDARHGDGSIPAYWDDLLRRGGEFVVMRNDQCNKVLESFQRIKAMVTFMDNADEEERLENHCRPEDLIEVVREEIIEFDKIDEEFRQSKQKYWIRAQ